MRSPRAIPRFFAAAAALAAVSITVSACDVSPLAASVNSSVIKQTALSAELRAWAGNREYVSAFDSSNGSSGVTVVGDAPGTYNNEWVSSILTGMITASVVHQRLQATGRHVTQSGLEAARAVSEISQIGWMSFPPSFRDTLTYRLAEAALVTPPLAQLSQAFNQVYEQYRPFFFSRVCVVQASAFSLGEASVLAAKGDLSGESVCYSQSDLEQQAAGLRSAIMGLAVGKVSKPVPTPYGYLVVKVTSRAVIGLTDELKRTISVAIMNAQGAPNNTVNSLLTRSKVKVNPAYGTWSATQVVPPKAPGSSA